MNAESKNYLKLEKYFNLYKFRGIPIGSTIADLFILTKIHGPQKWHITFLHLGYEFGRLLLNCIKPHRQEFNMKDLLITRLADKPHLNNMMNPIIDDFLEEITIIANPIIKFRNNSYQIISIKHTHSAYRNDLFQILLIFFKILSLSKSKVKRLKLSRKEHLYFCLGLLAQVQVISFYNKLFKEISHRPKVVLTEFDRNSVASPLILTSRKFGIKTITLVHGAIGDYGFTPVLADYIFCFGEVQKKKLIELKVPDYKIIVTGTTIIDSDSQKIDYSPKNNSDKAFVVGLGINPLKFEYLKNAIEITIDAISKLSGVDLIIKLHPSQKKEQFKTFEKSAKGIKILSSTEVNNNDFFQRINLLIIQGSALGIEAMIFGVPVAIIDTGEVDLSLGNILADKAGCPIYKNSHELVDLVNKFRTNTEFIEGIRKRENAFAKEYYFATGKDASRIIRNSIRIIIEKG